MLEKIKGFISFMSLTEEEDYEDEYDEYDELLRSTGKYSTNRFFNWVFKHIIY